MVEPDAVADLTVDELKARVQAGHLNADAVLAVEKEGKERITLTEWLENRLADAESDSDDEDDADAEAEAVDDADEDDDAGDDGPETVRVANTHVGSIAGMHFDRPRRVVEVERTARIEEAIKDGDLRVQQ